MKGVDVRTTKINGETYANVDDLIKKINQHGMGICKAFTMEEFREVYTLAYCHIEELLELIKNY